jgi:hypothetical protein
MLRTRVPKYARGEFRSERVGTSTVALYAEAALLGLEPGRPPHGPLKRLCVVDRSNKSGFTKVYFQLKESNSEYWQYAARLTVGQKVWNYLLTIYND